MYTLVGVISQQCVRCMYEVCKVWQHCAYHIDPIDGVYFVYVSIFHWQLQLGSACVDYTFKSGTKRSCFGFQACKDSTPLTIVA